MDSQQPYAKARHKARSYFQSVMDRIVHNAIRIQMGDVNMRERTVGKQR